MRPALFTGLLIAKLASAMKYDQLLAAIASAHDRTSARAVQAINQSLLLRNWWVGAHLVMYEQAGSDRATYGGRLLQRLAADLAERGLKGLAVGVLERCRRFFLIHPDLARQIPYSRNTESLESLARSAFEISPTVSPIFGDGGAGPPRARGPTPLPWEEVARLTWSHWVELIRLDDPWKRAFYENECLRGGWSIRQLRRQIETLLYERTALSTDKQAVIERGRSQASDAPLAAQELIRDPYVLEFTGLAEQPRWHESDLETALLDNLQGFLLELGTGFCFEARQFRIHTGTGDADRVDLVFYHRKLRCHVLVELKVRAFQHGDAGQMNYYLNWFRANLMEESDQPPIGILLCSDRNEVKVEYATGGLDNQLFVSRYLVALPSLEQLRDLIAGDRDQFVREHPEFAYTA